jgi:shikimate kinase
VASADAAPARRFVTLVGFMGAGKSKIGRLLAERLGMAFADSDRAVEAATGKTIAEIFESEGEASFRATERQAITHLLDGEPKVVAVGGGAFVNPDTRAALNAAGVTIWLDPPFDVLLSRLRRSKHRPLASARSDADVRQLWESRRASYAQARLRIATSDDHPSRFVDDIVARLS